MIVCIYGVISKILYPESVANALSLRIYRTPPCKFNCPSRPKIQKTTCESLISIKTVHTCLARSCFIRSCWNSWAC